MDKFFLTLIELLYIISMLASLQGVTMPETATIPASGKCRSSRHSFFSDAERDMRLDAAAARGHVKTRSPVMEQTEQSAGYSWRRQYVMNN